MFCLSDGNKLVDDAGEQETLASPRIAVNPFPASGIAEFCPGCGHGNKGGARFCKKCGGAMLEKDLGATQQFGGFAVNFNPPPGPTLDLSETVTFQPPSGGHGSHKGVSDSSNQKVIIGAFAATAVLILGVAYLLLSSASPGSSTANNNSAPANNTTTSGDRLPNSFERNYSGTIGTRSTMSLTMSLKKNGAILSGRAETPDNWDALQGTINPDGSFQLNGNERGGPLTGTYLGTIYTDGSISGTWTMASGRRRSGFSLTLDP